MTPKHQAYWSDIRDRFLRDVELLLQERRDESAMLLMCSLLDAASSFYVGRTTEHDVRKSFRAFVTRYLSAFARIGIGDLLLDDDRRVNDCVDMLYFCYRNGLVHEGKLQVGIKLVRSPKGHLFSFNAMGTMELNIIPMYMEVQAAVKQYETDLQVDPTLQSNFMARVEYIERKRFKKEPKENHMHE